MTTNTFNNPEGIEDMTFDTSSVTISCREGLQLATISPSVPIPGLFKVWFEEVAAKVLDLSEDMYELTPTFSGTMLTIDFPGEEKITFDAGGTHFKDHLELSEAIIKTKSKEELPQWVDIEGDEMILVRRLARVYLGRD